MALILSDFQRCTLQQSCPGKLWPGNSGFGLLVRSPLHSSASVCLPLFRRAAATCALSQHLKKFLLFLFGVYSFPVLADEHVPLSTPVFHFYMSLIVGTPSPMFLRNFQYLTFSACHLVLSLQSHKSEWFRGGGGRATYIFPECIMVMGM